MNIGQIIVWIIIGGFAGTLAGRVVTMKKEGLGRWANLLVGMAGAVIGGAFFRLHSDVGRLLIVYRSRSGLGASFFVRLDLWNLR